MIKNFLEKYRPVIKKAYTFFLIDLKKKNIKSLIYQPHPSSCSTLYVKTLDGLGYKVILNGPLSQEIEKDCIDQKISIDIRWPYFFGLRELLAKNYASSMRRILAGIFSVWAVKAITPIMMNFFNSIAYSTNPPTSSESAFVKEACRQEKGPTIKFSDVIGLEQSKKELQQLVDFMRNPEKYAAAGAKLPLGVLLDGRPGTGKTLLAKAFAGEANVPFYAVSGSAFDEVFIGVGADRLKQLFAHARNNAPCVIFIDEIDSIGTKRSFGIDSLTLTQLLSEMDGFEGKKPVIIFAATNRAHALDSALLRPGRFDRIITTSLPNAIERKQIFEYYIKKTGMPVSPTLDLDKFVRRSVFFSPADISFFLNEAGLAALRQGKEFVDAADFEKAFVRLARGHRRDSYLAPHFKEKKALLSAAETVVAWKLFKESSTRPIHVSIFPEENASCGVLLEDQDFDRFGMHKPEYFQNLLKLLCTESIIGGRFKSLNSEKNSRTPELFKITDEFSSAPQINAAKKLIIRAIFGLGFSKEFGNSVPELSTFKLKTPTAITLEQLPDRIKSKIEKESSELLRHAQEEVFHLLQQHEDVVLNLKTLLLEKETLNTEDMKEFFQKHQM